MNSTVKKLSLFPLSSETLLYLIMKSSKNISMQIPDKEDSMDKRINRFKICDLRFHPYLVRVIDRLPEQVREDFLNNTSFQLFTDDEVFEASVLRYDFSQAVKSVVYLNSKILMESDHQIIHTIASEIARYVLKKEEINDWEKKLDDLLNEWGFGKEIEAVRNDRAVSESKK